MAGSREGGLKAAKTNLKKHGKDFYRRIGHMGGKAGLHTGGFATKDENGVYYLAISAGRKGGLISRRGPSKKGAKKIGGEE